MEISGMPKKKMSDEFILELKEKAPGIQPLEPYLNSANKIKCECKKCGNQWYVTPAHLLSGRGCPICARKNSADKRRYSKKEFSKKVHLLHPNIEVIGEYVNSQTKIEVHCNKCDNKWSVIPASLLRGTGCPKCNKRFRRNTEKFIEELSVISPHISVLGQYKNAHEKIKVRCDRCKTEWYAEPNGLLKGNDCPYCGHSQTSIVEQIIFKSFCLILGNEKVLNRDKATIGKELDIYIPELALAVEFGAWYWHSNNIQNDIEKERLCDQYGIHLITIYEGCPNEKINLGFKNAVCYTKIISSEKDFVTVRDLIIQICQEYKLNSSVVIDQWRSIIKQSKDDSRKKDAEKFSQELSELNPNIVYLGAYSGSKNHVYVMCMECGTKWYASSAYDLLHGHGCPECAKILRGKSQRMTSEEFRNRVSEINPDIEVLEDYNGFSTRILCRCKKCETEWRPKPDSILYKKRNCPNCSPVTKKTDKQFRDELLALSENILPLEKYKNINTRIRFKCGICNYEWFAKPKDILQGTGCPKCANRISLSHEEFINRIQQANNTVEIIGKYIDSKTKVKCRCKMCGYEWLGLPSNLLHGAGCQRCSGTLRLTNEEFLEKLMVLNPRIKPLGTYINRNTKIQCHCEICGNEWEANPGNLLNGHGCPKCKANKARKVRERKIICIETGQIYDSIAIAKKETGITTISDCLNRRTKTAGKYHWAYIDKMNDYKL